MPAVRQAIMRISRPLLLEILPADCVLRSTGEVIIEEGIGKKVDYSWLEKLLQLPANARITGVSTHAFFMYDQVLIRVECPDFIETQEGCQLPEVLCQYRYQMLPGETVGTPIFGGRLGDMALTQEYRDTFPERNRQEREAWAREIEELYAKAEREKAVADLVPNIAFFGAAPMPDPAPEEPAARMIRFREFL